jgi:hypothetical protein
MKSRAKPNIIIFLVFSAIVLTTSSIILQYGYSQTNTSGCAGGTSISYCWRSKNNSDRFDDYVKIVATLYEKGGKVVGTDFTYSDIDVQRPAEKSPFEIILTDRRAKK